MNIIIYVKQTEALYRKYMRTYLEQVLKEYNISISHKDQYSIILKDNTVISFRVYNEKRSLGYLLRSKTKLDEKIIFYYNFSKNKIKKDEQILNKQIFGITSFIPIIAFIKNNYSMKQKYCLDITYLTIKKVPSLTITDNKYFFEDYNKAKEELKKYIKKQLKEKEKKKKETIKKLDKEIQVLKEKLNLL